MSFVRNLVGAVFPLFTTQVRRSSALALARRAALTHRPHSQLYNKLGVQGAGGLTAGLAALLSATPFLLYRYGARLRARSPFAKELARLAAKDAAEVQRKEVA